MKQEDKNLLLKDLCGRLPYYLKVNINEKIETLNVIGDDCGYYFNFLNDNEEGVTIENIKPYLFPLSSMTEEQKKFFKDKPIFLDFENDLVVKEDFFGNSRFTMLDDWLEVINWCYENHFDIYGLIPKKLAIDATGLNIY